MRGLFRGVAAIATLALVVAAGAAGAPRASSVNEFCSKELRPCGDVVVLGTHRWFNGRVAATAFSTRIGPCLFFEHADGGGGSCGRLEPPATIETSGLAVSSGFPGHPGYTEITALLNSKVAGVNLRYRAKGRGHRLRAFTVQVAGRTLHELKVKRPFGIAEATVPGCVPGAHLRLTAYDAEGMPLGSVRGYGRKCALDGGPPGSNSGSAIAVSPGRVALRLPPG